MKKVLLVGMTAFIVFGLTSMAAAVQFYAIDEDHDGKADIEITDININDPLAGGLGQLFYKLGTEWFPFVTPLVEVPTTAASDWKTRVELAVMKDDDSYLYSPYSIEFLGENLTNHYDSLSIYWTALSSLPVKIDFISNQNGVDNLMPVHAPLPGAFWLLGSGILCLAGYRTRKQC
ncbi:MAG: hypothetical protein ABIK92_05250 [Pseudomonadota bacterium]